MAVATGTAMLGAAAIGGIGSILSGIIGANAANSAASIQEKAALADVALQKQGLDYTKQVTERGYKDSLPWMTTGKTALNQYLYEMKLPGSTAKKSGFQQTPGYAFQVSEGEKGVTNNLAALGMKNSGAALKALTKFRTGLADQEYGTYMDRLGNLATGGGNAAANSNSNALSGANSVSSSLQGIGQTTQDAAAATASGYINGANAITGAVNNFSNTTGNALGWMSQNPTARRRAA